MEIERKIITLKTVHNDKEILEIKENIYTICWGKNYEIRCYEIWQWLEVERKVIIKIIMIKKNVVSQRKLLCNSSNVPTNSKDKNSKEDR